MKKYSLFFCLFLLACSSSTLPENRPHDLAIEFKRGLGDISEELKISSNGNHYTRRYRNSEINIDFPLEVVDLDRLYQSLRDNCLDQIGNHISLPAPTDKVQEAIRVTFKDHNYVIVTKPEDISLRWRGKWKNLIKTFDDFIAVKKIKTEKEFSIFGDESLAGKKLKLSFSQLVSFDESIPLRGLIKKIKLLPGNYIVTASLESSTAAPVTLENFSTDKNHWLRVKMNKDQLEFNYATQEGENLSTLPPEVKNFVEKREGCDHWRGEYSENKERQKQIQKEVSRLCTGSDAQLKQLKTKYKNNSAVMKVLNPFEAKIE